MALEHLRSAPGSCQETPGATQKRPGECPERPKTAKIAPKSVPGPARRCHVERSRRKFLHEMLKQRFFASICVFGANHACAFYTVKTMLLYISDRSWCKGKRAAQDSQKTPFGHPKWSPGASHGS